MVSITEKRRVYVLCRPIFSGENARVRKRKKVKEMVNSSRISLLEELGEAKLVEALRSLLENRIFESELRAKNEFPDLFRPSPSRHAQRQASEVNAAKSTAEALDEVTRHHSEERRWEGIEDQKSEDAVESEGSTAAVNGDCSTAAVDPLHEKLPSLYPSYLPYETQHLILNTAQRVLEECCFEFAQAALPSVLQQKKWDCHAAVELTQWVKVFRAEKGLLSRDSDLSTQKTSELLTAISNLRHTAVHRVRTTAKGITMLLGSAVRLAQILQDSLRSSQLEELRIEVDHQIKAMELNKNLLEDMALQDIQKIQRERERLDRVEAELIHGMLKDDMNNKVFVGQVLKNSVHTIFSKGKGDRSEEKQCDDETNKDQECGREGHDDEDFDEERNSDEESAGKQSNIDEDCDVKQKNKDMACHEKEWEEMRPRCPDR